MIHRVGSLGDLRLAAYRHVAEPAWLREHGLFVAEGRLVVERLLDPGPYRISSVLVSEAAFDALGTRLIASGAEVYVCAGGMLRELTGFNFHRGCLALAARPAPLTPEALATATHLLGLEGVGNPDNVGGLFRTAAAFGVGGVLLDEASGDPLYRKAVRTSMAASLRVPWARAGNWFATLEKMRCEGFRLLALTPSAAAVPITQLGRHVAAGDRLMLLAGSEGAGLRDETLALADLRLRIPIDRAVDSLNVVVAAGIALHALAACDG